MEWIERLAEQVRTKLDAQQGPLKFTTADLQAAAGSEPLPPTTFWSSLQAYLIFGMRGIDVGPVILGGDVVTITFQAKQFALEWLPAERCSYLRATHPFERSSGRTQPSPTKK